MSRLAQLLKLHEADPRDADVLYMLAQEHAKAGDTAAAVQWYDRCIALDPHYHYAYFHKARALESAGDVPAALQSLRLGLAQARAASASKAMNELAGYIDQLEV
jgi:tetratricopeptide (TPR) repeat protein